MNAGDINVKIKGDNSDLAQALHDGLLKMQQAKREAKRINLGKELFGELAGGLTGKSLLTKGIGLLGLGGGIYGTLAALKSATSGARDLQELSTKLNETIEDVAKLKPVAKATRTEVEDLALSFLRLEKTLGDPSEKKVATALEHLGFTVSDLTRMTLPEKMLALNEAFHKARAEGTGVADFAALIGKGYQNLIPTMAMATDELRKLMDVKPNGEMLNHMAELDKRIDAVMNRMSKAGKIFLGGIAMGLEEGGYMLMDLFTLGSHNYTGKYRKALKDEEAKRKEDDERKKQDKETAAETQKELAAAEEKAKHDKDLAEASEKFKRSRHELLPDDNKMQEDIDELNAIFEKMQSINQEASEQGVLKWAESLQLAGDVEGLDEALRIMERMKRAKTELEHLEKAQHERQAYAPSAEASALNILTGRQDSLIVDETKRQTQLLDMIARGIDTLNGKHGAPSASPGARPNYFDLSH